MGMYTELNMSVELNANIDENTLKVLKYMLGDEEVSSEDIADILPDFPLFKSDSGRWTYMLNCDSFYFDHTAHSELVNRHNVDTILNVRCDLKNYDDEIEHFLDWVYTFTPTRGFVGYMRYEEDKYPTLIYFTDTGVEYKVVK